MAVKLTIADKPYDPTSYSISEDATPVKGGDSSGSVGTFDVTIPERNFNQLLAHKAEVTLSDSQWGSITGKVDKITRSDDGGTFSLNCIAETAELAVYNVTAKPYSGTLAGAVQAYIDLANSEITWWMPALIGNRPVSFIGWTGELWIQLKALALAQGLEINLMDGIVRFQIPGKITIPGERVVGRGADLGSNALADRAELYWYETRPLATGLVYPPHKDIENAQVYSIPAGQETEIMLELSASLSAIIQPTYQETIAPDAFGVSSISLTREGGEPVSVTEWERGGGHVRVEITDDPTRVKMIVRGPGFMGTGTFRLATTKTHRFKEYTSIRLLGSGVDFMRNRVEVPTGVRPGLASSEMAPTQDNIFVTDASRAWDLCASHALTYSSPELTSKFSGPKLGFPTTLGRAPGARFYDQKARHWFRTKSVGYGPGEVTVSGELDTRHSDSVKMYAGMTFNQVKAMHAGKTYEQVRNEGVTRG